MSLGERIFEVFNILFLILLCLVTLYPFIYVLFASLSEPAWVVQQRGLIWHPSGLNLEAYRLVFDNPMITSGYLNTLFIVSAGTFLNVFMTALGAYGLSRQNVMWKNPIMFFIVFTMFFSGGLIPSYLLVTGLGMLDSLWALIIPGAVSAFNLIIMRTAFQSIPHSLEESAKLDGANDFTVMIRIILPLSMPVIAVMILFYGVGHWNSWFGAMIYLRDRELYPLQLVLREILITNSTDSMLTSAGTADKMPIGETIKYATIIVATVPILLLYPFLQKYFVKGVMIGAIKE
ncbi:carbohydrate ABC transporter permease [Paenibacillus thiaminolyticus]|uniref:Carbohydrate ABC transporter permease n=1 Tax=Paenibacillus thiaminolyticus TaxID=49283 RepID=A0AAP9DZI5_PANTH|nr:carbohydrate ABC transporter permease [Paenibacillus thiaminolyticus]MCY9537826.1 carbohydrate ABC transporter permease [Paenibacillus thiaminolyticus]MCY9605118.1 carbohydrate ABC transporter permease [Paenibacillus thiaminolyticus]MCY9607195.1 carbohydrate ABC transporter permease [Paenibacillus thiaminolyticus]MCY9616320.1 carbohydrate ABC transporter permease [Paenibacillus thiaminolyticus]MCY9620027.1 carbohydrate ABC transporter permease [Paenibacillus thiaminolyticus]